VHVRLTGRRWPEEIIAMADTVTEMSSSSTPSSRHPAQRGIED
jgi:cob(I)alamin adenosyltransferase